MPVNTSAGMRTGGFVVLQLPDIFTVNMVLQQKVIFKIPDGMSVDQVVYGWEPYTTADLVNGVGLPSSTFKIELSGASQTRHNLNFSQ